MSRIGKLPIPVPSGVSVTLAGQSINVEGPKGKLDLEFRPEIAVAYDESAKQIIVTANGEDRTHKALHGLTRALIQNMMVGVSQGYEKKLEIQGVGYIAAIQDNMLQLRVGFAHEVHKNIPAGLDVTCPDQTHIIIRGPDKQKVGHFAAEVRAVRKPEPYKGKGIRYDGEAVRRKAGKAMTK